MRKTAAMTAKAATMIAFAAALMPRDTFSCAFVSPNLLLGSFAGSDALLGGLEGSDTAALDCCSPSSSVRATTAAPQPGQVVEFSSICVPHFSQVIIRFFLFIGPSNSAFNLD